MTRNMPLRSQQSRDSFVRSEVRPVAVEGMSLHASSDHGYLRSQASRDSLRRSRVVHVTGEQPRHFSPARYQRAGFVQSQVASATPIETCSAPQERFQRSPIVSVTTGDEEPNGYGIDSPRSSMGLDRNTESFDPEAYAQPFIKFMTENPTVFHAVSTFGSRLEAHGYKQLSERDDWELEKGGKYYITRNGSGLVAFSVGSSWKPGDRAAVVASHVDALTTKVKPISTKPTDHGYQRLGVAHYGGALSQMWIDRDLAIGGRVFIRDGKTGQITSRLVKIPHPVGRIPSIAPHFGLAPKGQENRETRMVPIIGLDNSDIDSYSTTSPPKDSDAEYGFGFSAFASTQPPKLVKAIARELSISPSDIVNWELEMYSAEPATLLGLDREFISAGRIDDKLCAWAAVESLIASNGSDGVLNIVGLFDDEEVGSLMRQGARSNFLPGTVQRICESFGGAPSSVNRTFAKSFMISADVCHAYNPNYSDVYLADHTPRLNVGVAISFDSNAHMTTDGVSSTILAAIAEKSGSTLQPFQIRNDSRSGGTVGPMLSSMTGMRAVDAGIPQLSMHSIRATTGSLDPGLGVKLFKGFFDNYEAVDQAVQQE